MPPQSGRCAPCPAARSAGPQEAAEDAAPVSVPSCRQGLFQYLRPQERNQNALINQHVPQLGKSCPKRIITRSGQGIPPPRKDGSNGPAFHEEKGNDSCGAAAPVHNQCRSSVAPSAGKPFAAGIPQAPFIPFTGGGSPFLPMLQAFQQKAASGKDSSRSSGSGKGLPASITAIPPVRKTGKLARTVQGVPLGTGRRIQGQRIVHNQGCRHTGKPDGPRILP